MHVKSLKVFCDVVVQRSFSRAADDNGISQSGASQMVHHLEEHLGVRLIDRSKRPFVLTPEGQVYYDGCRELVKKMSALEEEVRTLHEEVEGIVGVAAIYSVGLTYLNDFVQQFHCENPNAKVRTRYEHPDRVYELVENDQVDLGLVSYPKSSRTVKATPWFDESIVLVCSPEHHLANGRSISSADLQGLDVVGFDPNLKIRREIDRTLAARNVAANCVVEFDNIETIKRATEINRGAALLPAPTVVAEVESGTLVSKPICDAQLVRPLGIIHRRGITLKKSVRKFLEFLQLHGPSNERSGDQFDGNGSDKKPAGAPSKTIA